jgi:hypothetical protein
MTAAERNKAAAELAVIKQKLARPCLTQWERFQLHHNQRQLERQLGEPTIRSV